MSEDEFGELVDEDNQKKFIEVMAKIRSKKDEIYEKRDEDYFLGIRFLINLIILLEKDFKGKLNKKGELKEKPVFYKDLMR